ncbi:t-SNARE domain-containing protein 1-like [Dendronephthya gigantea]|uniref:t-SNARE domain-containing protein 1-like n=1 Tax=Dendronephthya gigantea TaxID=151771 RepID=UPI00106B4A72|nr:t-SNARE domain-containing protein 1-like [Dendronephthya gigantea]
MEAKKARKPRKPNFSTAECNLILQLAEENIETIREKFSNTLTNQKKHAVWRSICNKVNALGVALRSETDVREKWRAMCGVARKEMGKERQSIEKTGGGRPTAPPTSTSQRIIEIFGDEPGFSGIQGGIESGTSFTPEPESFTVDSFDSVGEEPLLQGETVEVEVEVTSLSSESTTPKSSDHAAFGGPRKKRKITNQDVQSMHIDVLQLEKRKIELEVENLELTKIKLQLEIEELKARVTNLH